MLPRPTLNLRAVLTIQEEGRIGLVGPARGRRGAIKRLAQDILAAGPAERLAVAHSRALDEAEALPEGAVVVRMLSDYAVLRDQARACR